MAEKILHVLMHGQPMGRVIASGNKLAFFYEDAWRERADALPLSLSLPLAAREYPHKIISAYLWNLLPDNHDTLLAWAKQFGVKLNAFALLTQTGEDVAGAAQFVRPDRLEELQAQTKPTVQWIDEAEIARRLRELRVNRAAWSQLGDSGYFSLSGAQPKIALYGQDDRWGIASGRTPTTHILKPPARDFDGFAENEHFCLSLAAKVGLPVARSTVIFFEDEPAFVTERFDRVRAKNQLLRVPTEDLCQALGVPPESKYQNMGGPAPEDILRLLASESSQPQADCETFFNALVFNALIGGTDAHAKNYTLLHGGGRVRLAPLYDVASALPYFDPKALKLAMKIGSHYELRHINARDWEKLGVTAGVGANAYERVREMADRLPALLEQTAAELHARGLTHPMIEGLEKGIALHALSMRH